MNEDEPTNNGAPEFSGYQILGPGSDSEPWDGKYTSEGRMRDVSDDDDDKLVTFPKGALSPFE